MEISKLSGVIASDPRWDSVKFTFLLRDDFGQEISCCSSPAFTGEAPKQGSFVTLSGSFPADLNAKADRCRIFSFNSITL